MTTLLLGRPKSPLLEMVVTVRIIGLTSLQIWSIQDYPIGQLGVNARVNMEITSQAKV